MPFGDGAFLEQVLIALALVTGSGDFSSMVKIGIVLGILLLGFQAIMSGGRGINPGQLVIAWLVYGLAFGSTQTVTITDTYSQTVRPVDDVPVGVAAAGSILSSIGFQITELFETAFSTPTMTTQGYASSLETLKRVRLNTLSVFNLGRANAVQPGADFYRSWQQYIKECTLPGLETGLKTLDDIYRNPDLLTALRYDVGSNTTEIRIGGDPQTLECNAAHDLLAAFTTDTFLPDFKQNVLPHVLNLQTPAGAAEVEAVIDDALDGLGVGPSAGGIGVAASVDADQFILTSVLVPIYYEAAKQRYQDDHKFAYATMVDDAIRARNAQWLANQSLFERFVRPMLTFLEGFLFAVIPVLALFIPIGMLGVRSVARFLLMVGWIQLWLPALAIVNLFLHDVVAGKLEGLDAAGMPITSMAGLFQADDVLQTWLATGGLMASAVPALTLMLVYGGAISANFLASRLRGDDVVAETQAAPRSFDPWVGTHIEPMSTYNPQVGASVMTGGAGRLLSFNYSREGTAVRESAYQAHSEQLEQFRDALGTGLHSTYGDDMRGVQGAMWNDRATAENNQALALTYSSAGSVVDQIQAQTGWTHQEALRFTVSGLAGLGLPGSGGKSAPSSGGLSLGSLSPVRAHIDGSLSDEDAKIERSGQIEIADRILREEVGDNEELRAGLITALAADIHEGGESSLFKTETFDNSRELASEASETLSSARHYEESIRDSTSAGSQISLPGDYAASLVAGSQPASRLLGNSIAAYGMVGEVDAYLASPVGQGLVQTFDGDQALARTYVELGVLDGSIDTGMPSAIGEGGRAMVDDILATANGVGGRAPTGASVNAAMAGGLPLTGTVRESVERADELTAGRMADVQQGIDGRLQGAVDAHGEGVAAQHVSDHQAIQSESALRRGRAEEGFAEFEQRQDRMAAEHRHPLVEEVDGATDAAQQHLSDKLRQALGSVPSNKSTSHRDPED